MLLRKIAIILLLIFPAIRMSAQDCDSNYFSIIYGNSYYSHTQRSIVTKQNEIITIANLNYPHSNIMKLTAQGNILWADELNLFFYTGDYYANLAINDIIAATDSTYFVVGTVQGGIYSPPGLYYLGPGNGLLINIDKYGHVLWTRRFFLTLGNYSFTNIYKTTNGDFIIYMAIDNGASEFGNNGKVICVSPDGNAKWASYLSNDFYNAAGGSFKIRRSITQASNGNIVIGDVVYRKDFTRDINTVQKGNLHFFALDPNTGSLVWETSYYYPIPSSDSTFVPNIINARELPDGKLSFLVSSLSVSNTYQSAPVQRAIDIITDNTGNIVDMVAY